MPGLDALMTGSTAPVVPQQDNKEAQAKHAAVPQAGAGQNAKTIVLALLGFMVMFYLLHIAERWVNKA